VLTGESELPLQAIKAEAITQQPKSGIARRRLIAPDFNKEHATHQTLENKAFAIFSSRS
jgi:hypothetical protein